MSEPEKTTQSGGAPSISPTAPIAPGQPSIAEIYRALTPGSGPVPSVESIWSTRPDVVDAYRTVMQSVPGYYGISGPGTTITPPSSVSAPPAAPFVPPVPTPTSETPTATDDELAAALASIFADGGTSGGGGYSPSFVDLGAAEAMLPLTQTPEEKAALEQMLADLQRRGEEGIAAVRSGWEGVRAVNQAAADKARQMAIEAGPEAARLWVDAANNALTFARQTADAFTNIAGMQSVNISPTGGAQNIAALLAAQAPRAQAFAERMGLASAQDIASQARTAAMMGAAYAGEITRTVLQQAQEARAAHNQRVLDRIAQNQQTIAGMRASAAATNAQIANQAAQFAASQVASMASTPERRREIIRELASDINDLGTSESGPSLIAFQWNIPEPVARQLIEAQQQGLLDWTRAQGILEAELQAAGG